MIVKLLSEDVSKELPVLFFWVKQLAQIKSTVPFKKGPFSCISFMAVDFVLLGLANYLEVIWVVSYGFQRVCSSAGTRFFKAWILNLKKCI